MRKTALIVLLASLTLGLVACGGDDGPDGAASSGGDVGQLLQETFANGDKIESGVLDLTLKAESTELESPAIATLKGPFQSEGKGRLPRVALAASLEGSGQSFQAGLTNTGEKGYVSFQGKDYAVSGPVFEQFKAAYEQAASQGGEDGQSLASLGLDPRKWLTNAKDAGTADVGGTETTKITGDVDVDKLLDDVNTALEKARSLGLQGSDQLPEQLTPEQRREAIDAIDDIGVEVYTGSDDHILRRLLVTMKVTAPEDKSTADVSLDVTLTGVNEDQEIPEPSDARPFSELADQLGGLGFGLGALGGSGSGGGGAAGGGADAQALEKYSQCVQEAAGDQAKTARCADLLTP